MTTPRDDPQVPTMHNDTVGANVDDRSVSRRALLATAAVAATGLSAAPATAQPTRAQGRSALVTGSSRGIGAAIARRLARDGYAVTVNYFESRDQATAVVRDIEAARGRAIMVQADVSDPAAVRRLFDAHDRAFGGVDVVVANAGIVRVKPTVEMTDEDFDRMYAVNAKGGFNTMREAARRVRTNGRIIALSSTITLQGIPAYGCYAGTKAVQDMVVNSLAKELRGKRISVTAVAPGPVNTRFLTDEQSPQQLAETAGRIPHGRLGEPADVANLVSALCGADGFWVSGTTVYVDAGMT